MSKHEPEADPPVEHRFLDEAGDSTFFGKGHRLILGENGVSLAFIIGMLKVNEPLPELREVVRGAQRSIEGDSYVNTIPSVAKKIARGGFHFHAKDDPPEVREVFFKLIKSRAVSFESVVARKIAQIFLRKHHEKESEFYADLLSHLIKNKLSRPGRLVLNVSHRANSTSNTNLQLALDKAVGRASRREAGSAHQRTVVFNVQNYVQEPLLSIADYCCWAVQRVFERGETRYYDFLGDQIRLVLDLYDEAKYAGSKHYYRDKNRLTSNNKLSPHSV